MVGRSHHMEFKVYGVYNKTVTTLWKMPSYHSLQISLAILARGISVFSHYTHHLIAFYSFPLIHCDCFFLRIKNAVASDYFALNSNRNSRCSD